MMERSKPVVALFVTPSSSVQGNKGELADGLVLGASADMMIDAVRKYEKQVPYRTRGLGPTSTDLDRPRAQAQEQVTGRPPKTCPNSV